MLYGMIKRHALSIILTSIFAISLHASVSKITFYEDGIKTNVQSFLKKPLEEKIALLRLMYPEAQEAQQELITLMSLEEQSTVNQKLAEFKKTIDTTTREVPRKVPTPTTTELPINHTLENNSIKKEPRPETPHPITIKCLSDILDIENGCFNFNSTIKHTNVLTTEEIVKLYQKIHELYTGALIVCDLDDTILYSGDNSWFDQKYQEYLKEFNGNQQKALEKVHAEFLIKQKQAKISPMEDDTTLIIITLLQSCARVIGLTARDPKFAELTIKQLEKIGIIFDKHHSYKKNELFLENKNSMLYHEGVFFVGNQSKGDALISIIKALQETEEFKKIVFIDDSKKNVDAVNTALFQFFIQTKLLDGSLNNCSTNYLKAFLVFWYQHKKQIKTLQETN
jgi:hypothetical protein